MFISSVFNKILNFIKGFWGKLPDEKKDEIIKVILEGFTVVLKAYYKDYKEKQNETKEGAFNNAK
ncbi:hypothetical protein A7P54_03855 [Acinetobacter sp. Ac_3412]|uniref:hypothetical protein n=1 Tax=Acinetobacter sp. Ac_3412 TaxID=1848935 RepID=UPI00148FB929|nr:hypothetical protein [Acinetobacter sp. Ac_3412]NNP75554.1 hypothetical protein [Acinetobacter sp. Ac_3412]